MPPTQRSESERRTRKERINPKLKASGWKIVPFEPDRPTAKYSHQAVEEYPTANGPADYGLVVDGELLGVVEAKKVTLGPQNVLTQAERYSQGVDGSTLDFRGYRVPFLYSTNGEVLWFQDVRNELNRSRKLAGFHTPDALREMLARDLERQCDWFAEHSTLHPSWFRPYQINACTAIENAIANRKRQMLVAMATGTGKTWTLVNQVYRLLESGVGKRILFLVDRRVLAAQAVRAFASFEPEPNKKFDKLYEVYSQRFQRDDLEGEAFDPKVLPKSYLETPHAGHAYVYVCTIQRMAINLFGRDSVWGGDEEIEDDAEEIKIPHHAFDVVIADECHRGYTTAEESVWRNTLDHFDAIKIGLTATPAAHTKAYFNDVVYRYEYARAVREGYLVDYDIVTIRSDVRMKGVFLKEGERVSVVDPETGIQKLDELEDQREFEPPEVEKRVTSPDSNRKILEELKKYAEEHETKYERFPKTLIFADNDLPHTSHADQLIELAVEVFGRGQSFARKITGRVDRPLQRIREFRNRPEPGIVVSVDLMSTGVDIPDLEFVVFLRQVRSRILFEQMLGRGTRKGEKYSDKSHFTAFDCFDGTLLAYFRTATAITAEPPDKPTRTIVEVIEDIWANRDRDYNLRVLVRRLQRIDKEMAGDARELFAAFGIADGDLGRYARELPANLRTDFTGAMKLLRDESFQALLVSYPRPKRTFIKADTYEDQVSSVWLVRGADGHEYKPEDYLRAFAEFVRNNPSGVQAIRILLNRPKEWSTEALTELKSKLAAAPQRFTIEALEKAHKLRYDKELVDIISMVKHAAIEEEPLLTAEQRVGRALDRLTARQQFTPDQKKWLGRIREHLVANLSIDEEDFETVPVLQNAGGWGNANRTFNGNLVTLLKAFNEAIAA